MSIQLGATAPDFEAETTEEAIGFHDWIGDSWPKPYIRIVRQPNGKAV